MVEKILDIKNLCVSLPTGQGTLNAVCNMDLSLNKGEILCLVGESGCGKSMTSMALMGLLPKKAMVTADVMEFEGQDLLSMDAHQRNHIRGAKMSMIFQEPMTSLNPSFKLGNQLCEGILTHKKITKKAAYKRAIYLLQRAGVPYPEERMNQYPHQLSGGLRQRVMIAMALMCEPDLIIADEPTTALDVTTQMHILALIKELQKEINTAIIFITHDLGVVAHIADKVAVMYAGQIVETGDVKTIFHDPKHPYTKGLLSCIPVPGKKAGKDVLSTIPGVVPGLIGEVRGCTFANRCAAVMPECQQISPHVEKVGENHLARCLLFAENAQRSAV